MIRTATARVIATQSSVLEGSGLSRAALKSFKDTEATWRFFWGDGTESLVRVSGFDETR